MKELTRAFQILFFFVSVLAFSRAYALDVQPSSLTVVKGKTADVQVSDASGSVRVSSNQSAIASVTYSAGKVHIKGNQAGAATISIRDKEDSKTVQVKVSDPVVKLLTVTPGSVSLQVLSSVPVNVSNVSGTLSVLSSNTAVAKADLTLNPADKTLATINIHGLKVGTATITVKDAKSSQQVAVTVIGQTPVLSVTPTVLVLNAGVTRTITVSNPNGNVNVVSSAPLIASVSYSSGIASVNALKAGTANITISDSKTSLIVPVTVLNATVSGSYTLLAWNDLGMHCLDGVDYSIFAILPPYNTLHAQLQDKSGKLVTSNVLLTYESVADNSGSINTGSAQKTNFWSWAFELFGANPAPNIGLNLDGLASGNPKPGNKAPSLTPAPMAYNPAYGWFEAEGIPVTPYDDKGNKNFYPTVKVVAKDAVSGQVLASTTTVLPVSDEMTCSGCHASTDTPNAAQLPAKPAPNYVFDTDPLKDWKRNILLLHDQKQAGDPVFQAALIKAGYPNGLLDSADNKGKPVLCVACHASNAYFDQENKKTAMGGMVVNGKSIPAFTQSLHLKHASVLDPINFGKLDDINNRTACYNCHPGSVTQCLRGPMGNAKDAKGNQAMSCQSCHGNLTAVASPARQGWYNEPTCQSCHNSAAPGHRALSGVDASGLPIVPADHTFASNDNTPVTGLNLYRFSTGHGGLQCEACHGATHAEYPSAHAEENLQSTAVQGHAGPVAECAACHTTMPSTVNGGPHGMHTTGNAWVNQHKEANKQGTATAPACDYCHGSTSSGTPLSALKVAKTIDAQEFGIKNWPAGYQVSCYSCHNGPNPD